MQTKFFTLNFVKLLKFCEETQLEKKLIGFTEKYINVKATNENDEPKVKIQKAEETAHQQQNQITLKSPLMQIKQLMRMLSTPLYDGRLLLSFDANKATLKYILLNPNICFEEIASQARSVILAGGTMKPVSIDILSYIVISKINSLP